jgi:hypothetical protein
MKLRNKDLAQVRATGYGRPRPSTLALSQKGETTLAARFGVVTTTWANTALLQIRTALEILPYQR